MRQRQSVIYPQEHYQLLLELVKKEGDAVVTLAYTPAFEALCDKLVPGASREDKHKVWEEIVRVQTAANEPRGEAADSELDHSTKATSVEKVVPAASVQRPVVPKVNQSSLFDHVDPIPEQQPWSAPQVLELSPQREAKRIALLRRLASSNLARVETRVADILSRYPETRDSDTALCIRYWKKYQADVLESWDPLELEALYELDRIETLGRIRRWIQHGLHLFRSLKATEQKREAHQSQLHEYLASHHDSKPEVCFFLDETGTDPSRYTGVGGVCIINWKQFEKHHAALTQWRAEQGWLEPVHFVELGEDKIDRGVRLMAELHKRRSGVLFLGYAISSRGRNYQDSFSLFIQLIVDSLKHLQKEGCLEQPRTVRVVKEANDGFDKLHLSEMSRKLSEVIAIEFPGLLFVKPIEAVPKGKHVLLECADLVAGGMQRRALMSGRKPKDRLAEAIENVTGFEDVNAQGAVYRFYR